MNGVSAARSRTVTEKGTATVQGRCSRIDNGKTLAAALPGILHLFSQIIEANLMESINQSTRCLSNCMSSKNIK